MISDRSLPIVIIDKITGVVKQQLRKMPNRSRSLFVARFRRRVAITLAHIEEWILERERRQYRA